MSYSEMPTQELAATTRSLAGEVWDRNDKLFFHLAVSYTIFAAVTVIAMLLLFNHGSYLNWTIYIVLAAASWSGWVRECYRLTRYTNDLNSRTEELKKRNGVSA